MTRIAPVILGLLAACGSETASTSSALAPAAPLALDKLGALSTVATNGDSLPRGFTVANGAVLFFSAIKKGLWRTDGTPQGTFLLRDLEPTLDSFQPTPHIVTLGTRAYWFQRNALWSTDGTAAGVTQVIEFPSQEALTAPVVYNGAIYFGTSTTFYRSDGTTAGTQPIVAVRIASGDDTFWQGFQELGGKLHFPCELGNAGQELCVSDGTAAGTKIVKELIPGIGSSSPRFLGRLGAKLLFSAQVPGFLTGLWVTDGTAAGTLELVGPGLNADAISTFERDFAVIGANAFVPCFTAAAGFELCKTDGTVAGTSVIDLVPGTGSGSPDDFALLGNRLFFSASNAAAGRELWSSNGTPAGTALFLDLLPGAFDGIGSGKLTVGGTLYFTATDTFGSSKELWKTDGTVGGTAQVKDILPDGKPQRYAIELGAELGGKLVFTADDGVNGLEPWVTNGTTGGTEMLKDLTPSTTAATVFEARAFAKASYLAVNDTTGTNIWRSDGTTAGTALYQTFNQQGSFGFTPVDKQLMYAASTSGTNALWKTDGTAAPVKITDLPGSAREFQVVNHKLAFAGTTPNLSVGLWLSDGTAAGTALAMPSVLNARRLGAANGALWLTGLDGGNGNELWTSDGLTARPVKDIRTGNGSSEPSGFASVGGAIVFAANDGVTGSELWRTDGTAAGTTLLADLRPGATGSGPFGMFSLRNVVLFWAASSSSGFELWKTDGTAAGTTMLKAISFGGNGRFVAWGDRAFFAAAEGTAGVELWRTDGTAAGTVLVRDVYAGRLPSNPSDLLVAGPNGPLFFAAEEPATGRELWRLDDPLGTPELAADLLAGPASSQPNQLVFTGTHLLVIANDGAGNAVYGAKIADEPPPDGAPPDAGTGGPDAGEGPGGNPGSGESSGCGCATDHDPRDAWPVLAVALLLLRRRRAAVRSRCRRRRCG